MAIYKRCSQCFKDNKLNLKKCKKCNSILNGEKYLVRVKDHQTGKWITKTVPSLKLAKKAEAKFKTIIIEGTILDQKKKDDVSFARYLTYAKQNKKTWYDDGQRWNRYVKGNSWQTTQDIQKILGKMKEQGLKPATIHHALKLIKRVYNYHIQIGLCQNNPCDTIQAPKYDNRVNNILSKEQLSEVFAFLKHWENRRASLVIQFAIFSGRRLGEILNLTWDDINLEQRVYTCRDTKNGDTLSFPLNDSLVKFIQEAEQIRISNYVFPSSTGNFYHSFQCTWQRLKKRLNLTIRFHDLRHTFASHLASSGKVNIYTLKTLLGHKDIKLTERYSHLLDSHLQEASSVIDTIFGQDGK